MKKHIVFLMLITSSLSGCIHSPSHLIHKNAPKVLIQKLQNISGPSAQACGTSMFGEVPFKLENFEEVVACTNEMLATKKPFWSAFQRLGDDSSIWEGVARQTDGRLVVVYYDSDILGGAKTPEPRITQEECSLVALGDGFIGTMITCHKL
jgi:hypothetical protein